MIVIIINGDSGGGGNDDDYDSYDDSCGDGIRS
jgi:hypothetical protein